MKVINIDISMMIKRYPVEFILVAQRCFKDDKKLMPTVKHAVIGDVINHSLYWQLVMRVAVGLELEFSKILRKHGEFRYLIQDTFFALPLSDIKTFINLISTYDKDFKKKIENNMLNVKTYEYAGSGRKLCIRRALLSYSKDIVKSVPTPHQIFLQRLTHIILNK